MGGVIDMFTGESEKKALEAQKAQAAEQAAIQREQMAAQERQQQQIFARQDQEKAEEAARIAKEQADREAELKKNQEAEAFNQSQYQAAQTRAEAEKKQQEQALQSAGTTEATDRKAFVAGLAQAKKGLPGYDKMAASKTMTPTMGSSATPVGGTFNYAQTGGKRFS